MGEKSKSIGEEGEKHVKMFFEKIGWTPLIKGEDIKCRYPKNHKRKESKRDRKEHGIDFIYSYLCNFEPDVRKHFLISVKNQHSEGGKSRTPAKIKDDLTDLDTALTCFKNSKLYNTQISGGGATNSQEIGILFYLDANKNYPGKRDSHVANSQFELSKKHLFTVIDCERFDFIESIVQHLKLEYTDWEVGYYVPQNSPQHIGNVTNTLPYSYLSSGPVLVSITAKGLKGETIKKLLIFWEEDFSEEVLTRQISLALGVTQEWADAILLYPDYNKVEHSSIANAIIQKLPSGLQTPAISCASYSKIGRTK